MTLLALVTVLVMSLPCSWSLTSLEKMALEMGHWNSDSRELESFTSLAVSPSDRKLLESAKSYLGTGYYSGWNQ